MLSEDDDFSKNFDIVGKRHLDLLFWVEKLEEGWVADLIIGVMIQSLGSNDPMVGG